MASAEPAIHEESAKPSQSQPIRPLHESTKPADLGIDPRYELVITEPVQGYGPLVDAWARYRYPVNVDENGRSGVIQGLGSRNARQFPDGSGVYESNTGARVYAVRTPSGVVVWNHDGDSPWPHSSEAEDEVDVEICVPFPFIGEVLSRLSDLVLYDEQSLVGLGGRAGEDDFVDGQVFMRGIVDVDLLPEKHEERGALLTHEDGPQVYVGWDSTARDDELFGFCPFDGTNGVPVPSATDALDLLTPNEADAAADSGLERQGEWYFVPTAPRPDASLVPKGTIQNPGVKSRPFGGSPLESHVPRDWKTGKPDLEFVMDVEQELGYPTTAGSPQEIFDAIHAGELDMELDRARELADGIYVRGSIRHRENDHTMLVLDDWRRAVTHDWSVLSVDGVNFHLDC